MDALGEVLGSFLSDPEKMSQIASLAEGLGFSLPTTAPEEPSCEAQPDCSGQTELLSSMLRLAQEAGRQDPKQLALLNALRPFLRKERQKDIDRALRAAQLSKLAGLALRSIPEKNDL